MTCLNDCNPCKKDCCNEPCSCPEPVFSVEAMPDDPTVFRFNVNGKSVWYDFEPVVKSGETCTTVNIDAVNRTFNYHGECSDQSISAKELGSILHLADIGDVNGNTIEDNGILNYRKDEDCSEGCEGINNGWVSSSPLDIGASSLYYILGSDSDGKLTSLMPPTDTSKFSYLAWAAQDKAMWKTPDTITTLSDNYAPLYIDKTTGEIVIYEEEENEQ